MTFRIRFGVKPEHVDEVVQGVNNLYPIDRNESWDYWDCDPEEYEARLMEVQSDSPYRDVYLLLSNFGQYMEPNMTEDRRGGRLLIAVMSGDEHPVDRMSIYVHSTVTGGEHGGPLR